MRCELKFKIILKRKSKKYSLYIDVINIVLIFVVVKKNS